MVVLVATQGLVCSCSAQQAKGRLTAQRGAFASGTGIRSVGQVARSFSSLTIESRYKGIGTDKSKVAQFKNNETDTGSPEVQIAQLSARVLQLTAHLQQHRKDYSSTRGLTKVLSHRRALMKYLQKHNRPKYDEVIVELNIRPLKVQAARGVEIKLEAASKK